VKGSYKALACFGDDRSYLRCRGEFPRDSLRRKLGKGKRRNISSLTEIQNHRRVKEQKGKENESGEKRACTISRKGLPEGVETVGGKEGSGLPKTL